jgi:hypothetical protein
LSIVARRLFSINADRWRQVRSGDPGQKVLRWVAGALSDMAGSMQKLRGFSHMRRLRKALDVHRPKTDNATLPKAA